jgi:hypothetical protein
MKTKIPLTSFFTLLCGLNTTLHAQDLDSLLLESMKKTTEFTTATFKATRIMNGHSVKQLTSGQMEFRVSHRFGPVNSGIYEWFGFDQAHIHLSFEYGITDRIMIGAGRGTFEKTYDGFTRISLFRQSTGVKNMPVSVSLMSGIYVYGLKWDEPERDLYLKYRLSYAYQLLVARKFSPVFSLQLTPSYLHQNLVETASDPNDIFALGAGTRLKLSKRISFNAEYFYLFKPDNQGISTKIYHPLSLGFDIETGGHVFQVVLTNSIGMRENAFLGHTTGRWLDGDIHLGFNISRIFHFN